MDETIKVLLVEDDEDDFVLLSKMFTRITEPRYDLRWARSYDQALRAVEAERFDTCLLDYVLGDRTGLALLQELTSRQAPFPIIMLTGRSDYDIDREAMQAGATDYLDKAELTAPLLERSIRYAIRCKQTEADLEQRVRERTEELRQAKEYVERIMDSSRNAIFVIDQDGRFLSGNENSKLLSGYEVGELIGRTYSSILPPDMQSRAQDLFQTVMSGGHVTDKDLAILRKDGAKRTILLSAAPMHHEDGSVLIVGSAVDITDRKRMEQELRQAKEAAEVASRAKSEFLANMSHEIRTPMNGILGMTELAIREDIPSQAREYLQFVRQSGKALLEIINDILDLSKIESGNVTLEHRPFRLRDGLESMLRGLSMTARDKGLEFYHSIDLDVPDQLVGDQGRLRQILTNLIGNGIKFTHKGAVRVSVDLDREPSPPGSVRLLFRVRDDGIGIPRDRLEEVFEPFGQVGLSSHIKYGGTGLGLSISRNLVELMGGRLWVDSEAGKGSTFSFTATFERGGARTETPEPADQVAETPAPYGTRKLKILLAEDNAVNRILAVALLERRGHAVTVVENGAQALEALGASDKVPFDAVLMDVRMPDMDGEEATRLIRNGEVPGLDPRIPIITLTAHALKGDRERFIAAGMTDYLAKPLDMDELDTVLARLAGKTAG